MKAYSLPVLGLAIMLCAPIFAQTASPASPGSGIRGNVVDEAGKAVTDATVNLDQQDATRHLETKTDSSGVFVLSRVPVGHYAITVSKSGQARVAHAVVAVVQGEQQHLVLTFESPARTSGGDGKAPSAATAGMEFSDSPSFTVAGVTDWTAVGGHGSDSTLRTSEDLARETAALKAQGNNTLSKNNDGDLHRLAGDAAEKQGNPLAAARQYQQAVQADPSEANYFAWGSELLLHRAVWQAAEVFRDGARSYPTSTRMLTALGAALFASDLYDEAAAHLCAASDLAPTDTEPYLFMGRIEIASPSPLPCVAPKLARFVQKQPENATANYLYAMALLKEQKVGDHSRMQKAEDLLTKAVTIDPKCSEAYVQLGILAAAAHNYEQAAVFYSKAITADPQSGEAHYRLGVADDRLGRVEQAKLEFAAHEEIERRKAAGVEQQRREIKQFQIQLHEPQGSTTN
jgi:tetratricopeptide (TPR) repeat protein